jgi:hypothetical protein
MFMLQKTRRILSILLLDEGAKYKNTAFGISPSQVKSKHVTAHYFSSNVFLMDKISFSDLKMDNMHAVISCSSRYSCFKKQEMPRKIITQHSHLK